MHDHNLWVMIGKLVAATLLGGLIGLERETHGRPAGLRTHILVCLGSALFALCSYSIAGKTFDPGRITAQIVTGIGFLGAGTIMHQGSVVRGLTTAASIWTVSAIGIAVAIGGQMALLAVATSVLVVITLNVMPHLEGYLLRKREDRFLNVVVRRRPNAVCEVLGILTGHGAQIRVLGMEEAADSNSQVLRVRLRVSRDFKDTDVAAELGASEVVISYGWE